MASRAYISDSLLMRGNKMNLLMQESGEQGVTIVTLRSGMLAAAVQVMTKQGGGL